MRARMATRSSRSSASPESARRRSGTRRSRVRAPRARRCWSAQPAESEARLSFAGLADLLAGVPEELYAAIPALQREAIEVALLRSRRVVLPSRACRGPRSSRSSDSSPTSGPSSSPSTTSSGSIVPRRRRSSSRCGGSRASAVRAIVSVRSEEAEQPLAGRRARRDAGAGSSSARCRSPRCTAWSRPSRPELPAADCSCGSRRRRAGIRCTRSRSRGFSTGTGERDAAGLPVPESLRALMAGAIGALPAETREALLRASALARPDLRLVDARALAAAEEAALVRIRDDGRIEFVHPLYASAVVLVRLAGAAASGPPSVAEAVEDPEERARHLALACDGPDERVAREVEEAARQRTHARRPGQRCGADGARARARSRREHDARRAAARPCRAPLSRKRLRAVGRGARGVETMSSARETYARACCSGSREIDYWRKGESCGRRARGRGGARGERSARAGPRACGRCDVRRHGRPPEGRRCRTGFARCARDDAGGRAGASRGRARRTRPSRPLSRRGFRRGGRRTGPSARGDGRQPAGCGHADGLQARPVARYVDDLDGARACLAAAEQAARDEGDESSLANILLNRVVVETWAGAWDDADEADAER